MKNVNGVQFSQDRIHGFDQILKGVCDSDKDENHWVNKSSHSINKQQ